jgi:hypothetical protein
MANEFNESTFLDDQTCNFGTSKDFKVVYDSADNRLEIRDTSDAVIFTMSTAGAIGAVGRLTSAGFLSVGSSSNLTIASGAITVTKSYHRVGGQGAAADDLVTINGTSQGDIVVIRRNSETITVKDATGNLLLNGSDCVLSAASMNIVLMNYDGTNLMELSRNSA